MTDSEYMIYGLLTPESLLVNRGYKVALAQGKRPSAVPSENVRTAIHDILPRLRHNSSDTQARLVLAYYMWDASCSPERDYAIALASNDRKDGLPNDPPGPEVVQRLKEVLGVRGDWSPSWYLADKSAEDVPRRV